MIKEIDLASKYLETLDNWRESHETTEELRYSLAESNKAIADQALVLSTAQERLNIVIPVLEHNKNNPSVIEECVVMLDMLRELFVSINNDTKIQS